MGTILPYVGDLADIPKGWYLCDGSNGTPDLIGRFLEGVTSLPGDFISARLPNIKGTLYTFSAATSRAFRNSSSRYLQVYGEYRDWDIWMEGGITFDAARYNNIYSDDCNTVQPSAYTVYYIIKII